MTETPQSKAGSLDTSLPAGITLAGAVAAAAEAMQAAGLAFGHGTDNARDEAAWLVLAALDRSPVAPVEDAERVLTGPEREAVAALLARRIETRRPLAYLLGRAWFCGRPFRADARALVPRSPIAELIENEFRPWLRQPPHRILELGTGGGCIAIACALQFPAARVDATDSDADALTLAAENVALHGVDDRVTLHRADVFDGLPEARYELIVANPPYVAAEEYAALPPEYRHEPGVGLAAGPDGLAVVRRILAGARDYLAPGGLLVVEVGSAEPAVLEAFPDLPFIWPVFEYGGQGVFTLNAEDLPKEGA